MLRVEGLDVAYGSVRALRDVSFEVPDASIVAVLGANGASKTTLLRTLSGLVRPRAGTVTLGGRDITRMAVERIVRCGMAHVPEGHGVIAELTVEENLRLGGLWRDGSDLAQVYEQFPPLAERAARDASTLSGGERQMLAIGRALMARPQLLLLDEPSLGLAPRVAAQTMALLRRLRDETGLTVLLVEQNAKGALSVADRGIVLNLGRIVAQDDPDKLASDDKLRHAYLGF
jgi:branched-chain amino acid transport system ATP-binding protein